MSAAVAPRRRAPSIRHALTKGDRKPKRADGGALRSPGMGIWLDENDMPNDPSYEMPIPLNVDQDAVLSVIAAHAATSPLGCPILHVQHEAAIPLARLITTLNGLLEQGRIHTNAAGRLAIGYRA